MLHILSNTHAVFGLCFVTVATFIKPVTEWNPSFSVKGICLSCIVPVLQIFVGLKDLNCSWVKQGLKSEGWQQILQDKVSFNRSIQGERLCTKCQWSHQNRKFIYRKQKGKERQEGGGESSRMWASLLGEDTHWMIEKDHWWQGSSELLCIPSYSGYEVPVMPVVLWLFPEVCLWHLKRLALNMTCSCCLASGNSQKLSIFHVTMGAERPREVTAKTDSKWPGLGGKAK